MNNEITGTTEPTQEPRRAVKLNAETLRALEVEDQNPTTYTAVCTAYTCRTCLHCLTPGCPQ